MKNLVLIGLFVVVSFLACIGIGYAKPLLGDTSDSGPWKGGVSGYAWSRRGGLTFGVFGISYSPEGYGVVGINGSFLSAGTGVWGLTYSPVGTGIKGTAFSQRGLNYGVLGESKSIRGAGVWGMNNSGSSNAIAVKGTINNPNGYPGYFEGGQGIKIPVRDTDPVNPIEGTIWINRNEKDLKMRIGGTTYVLQGLPSSEADGGKVWTDGYLLFYGDPESRDVRFLRGKKM